jgi:hypothetical protein
MTAPRSLHTVKFGILTVGFIFYPNLQNTTAKKLPSQSSKKHSQNKLCHNFAIVCLLA